MLGEKELRPVSSDHGTVDRLNARWGKTTVKQGSVGTAAARRDWAMRQARRTPHYTTDWRQAPVARA